MLITATNYAQSRKSWSSLKQYVELNYTRYRLFTDHVWLRWGWPAAFLYFHFLLTVELGAFIFDLMGRSNLPPHSKPAFLYYALLCPTNADIFLCSVIIQTTIITHFSCQLNSFFCEILYLKSDIFLPVYPLSKNCPMLVQNFFLLF